MAFDFLGKMKKKERLLVEHHLFLSILDYAKQNFFLIIFSTLCVFVAFSAKIFLFTIGLDTEGFIANKNESIIHWLGISRTALVALKTLCNINLFNPFYSTFISMLFLVFSAVSWAFFLSYFDKKNDKKIPVFAFVSIAVTSPIWAENLQFALQSAEVFFGIFITPFVIILLFEGFTNRIKKTIIFAIILMAFIICIYQSFAILFIFGFAVAILFMCQRSDFDKKLPLKIFIALIVSLTIYWLVGKLIILALGIEKYLYLMNTWNLETVKSNLLNVFAFIYILTFAKIELIHSIISSLFITNSQTTITTGLSISDRIFELSTVFGSIILLPLSIIFLIYIFREKIKINNLVYFSAAILILLSVLLIGIFLGNKPPLRTLFTLPFVFGFLFYFIISRSEKIYACIFTVLAFVVALNSSQISSALFYSDSERFRQDVFLAQQIHFKIQKIANQNEINAIAFIGKREPQKTANYIRGEVIGFSQFEFGADGYFESSIRAIMFMKMLGMTYEFPDSSQMTRARIISEEMPVFPQENSVKDCVSFILVKLSESSFYE
ncbi:MAG: glucosyltransferase domain-containing protein [Chitinispirillales bacterium]|jgi:hypothetical protein|nr:glucosyltransferase domain-containing protein [Chitinispirillales bacterium]